MKVLVVGSKSIHLSSFLDALHQAGVRADFLAEEECQYVGVQDEFVISFRKTDPFSVQKANRELRKLLHHLRPAVVHIHQVNRLAYFVARQCAKLGIPVVTTAWGSDVLLVPQQNRFYRFLVRKTLERSQIVTADSLEMIEAMKALHPASNKYMYLQYGIDLIDSLPKEKIIYSNRLHKQMYRIDQVIEYMDAFRKEYADWKLIIGGAGSETEALKRLVLDKGMSNCVEFVGWLERKDNQNWYARATIYISIPQSDGTAVSLLEAMSAGCIPVVPDLEVSREWINDGLNGVIEKEGKNPLLEAILLDPIQCANMNRLKVEKDAERSACTKQFIEYYRTLTDA